MIFNIDWQSILSLRSSLTPKTIWSFNQAEKSYGQGISKSSLYKHLKLGRFTGIYSESLRDSYSTVLLHIES